MFFWFLSVFALESEAQIVKVCLKVRGSTGLEQELKETLGTAFARLPHTEMTADRQKSHLYVDASLVEQEPIRFYGLGVAISYHLRDEFYSRPASDVAQFGVERMREVCEYLVSEIDKAYLVPLRTPPDGS